MGLNLRSKVSTELQIAVPETERSERWDRHTVRRGKLGMDDLKPVGV